MEGTGAGDIYSCSRIMGLEEPGFDRMKKMFFLLQCSLSHGVEWSCNKDEAKITAITNLSRLDRIIRSSSIESLEALPSRLSKLSRDTVSRVVEVVFCQLTGRSSYLRLCSSSRNPRRSCPSCARCMAVQRLSISRSSVSIGFDDGYCRKPIVNSTLLDKRDDPLL